MAVRPCRAAEAAGGGGASGKMQKQGKLVIGIWKSALRETDVAIATAIDSGWSQRICAMSRNQILPLYFSSSEMQLFATSLILFGLDEGFALMGNFHVYILVV